MNVLQKKVQHARIQLQNRKVSKSLLSKLYQAYQPIDDVDRFIERSFALFPHLNCGIASVYLQHIVGRGTVVQGTYGTNNHTFLVLEDGTIVDITADQYGGPPVYIGSLQFPWQIGSRSI